MSDAVDHDELYRLSEAQAGYFTVRQALAVGMDRSTLRHHARPGGRYERVGRGLYGSPTSRPHAEASIRNKWCT
ncbi:MAG: type IV toxin-antitoxin system AbiEi family antitoxin domain-containing protein [Pseudonocardiaceae bacterium]